MAISMSVLHCLTFLVTMVGVLITLSSVDVDAQSTVDDSASCESSSLDSQAMSLIREDLKDVKQACAALQQHSSAVNTSSLCEYKTDFFTTRSYAERSVLATAILSVRPSDCLSICLSVCLSHAGIVSNTVCDKNAARRRVYCHTI